MSSFLKLLKTSWDKTLQMQEVKTYTVRMAEKNPSKDLCSEVSYFSKCGNL
jgi:hypothetical protein